MHQEHVVKELLDTACPSIRYRIRREIFNEHPDSECMCLLQAEIVQDEVVKRIIRSQQPNGWLGHRFHGYDSFEVGVRLLCEKGVEQNHPVLCSALAALASETDWIEQDMGGVGSFLDELCFGGTSMMQATIFSYARIEDKPLVREQIQVALECLQEVAGIRSVEDITERYRDTLVFKRGVGWPGIYHLRLLAWTQSWRTSETIELVASAIRKLVKLSPIPYIKVRYKSQLIAPPSFAMQDFASPNLLSLSPEEWMTWFHRLEILARLGVINLIPELRQQVEDLCEMLEAGGGWFVERVAHIYFKKWGAYTGLMLEPDWKIERRRIYDLTFRRLLIQHYADNLK